MTTMTQTNWKHDFQNFQSVQSMFEIFLLVERRCPWGKKSNELHTLMPIVMGLETASRFMTII